MSIKEQVKEKIPERLQKYPEFGLFLKWIEENKEDIKNTEELKEVLEGQINEDQDFLNKESKAQTQGTDTRQIRPTAKEIDLLKKFKKLFLEHL
ncbi:hypothetical protein B6U93_03150 [Candidatus Woesearchaeota archaeon ex4484_78]|nr:MAG: hypothetical protein B6U93_03150 [Candidatus Woesearchaeota archaeon ex4484_78]